jgi:tRNA G18 (ribose-2'-O)-methylase SpoU
MLIESITDPADPRIAIYRDLKDKDLRRDNGFIVEGKFILETLLTRSRFKLSSVFISEDRILPLETLLTRIPNGVPIYVTTPDVMAEIAGYNVHRGILAAGIAQSAQNSLPAYLNQFTHVAVLSNISNPDNIGAIFRNAAGLGIEAVLLDAQCCSPLYRKAIRVSMGATLVLPWLQQGSIDDIIRQLITAGFTSYALSLQSAAKLEDIRFEKRSAFVFGEEAHGLPPEVQNLCTAITIPMSAGTDSLNVAATSAIVFDAARRQNS